MAYITITDIEGRIDESTLIRLTDEDNAGVPDQGKITDAITDAQAEVDSYCAKMHTVPFPDPVPAMIIKVAKDLAVFNLYSLKDAASDDCKDRADRARKYLKDVAAGTVSLGSDAPAETDDDGPEAIKTADEKTFSLDRLEGF